VVQARKDASGWAITVARMREKQGANVSAEDAERVVRFLERLREPIAREAVGTTRGEPREEWALLLDVPDLHRYDRDRNAELAGGELTALVVGLLDFDDDRHLSASEFALLPGEAGQRTRFERLDRNRDGRISTRELGVPQEMLEVLDLDGDGVIAASEVPRARPGPVRVILAPDAATVLAVLDRNRNGRLDRGELRGVPELLSRYDRDSSGALESAEIGRAVDEGRQYGVAAAFDDFLIRYDLNGDGKVSSGEFPGPPRTFRRCDQDGDGVVSARDAPSGYRPPDLRPEAQRWRR
jgi:Ca2+-binding EF-hand superfamily protein